jgi:hypothetical protein
MESSIPGIFIQTKRKISSVYLIELIHVNISHIKLIQIKTLRVFKKYAVYIDLLKNSDDFL